jgi:hypothetical protein
MQYDHYPVTRCHELIPNFGSEWEYVRGTRIDNVKYYVACDIGKLLKLSSTAYYVWRYISDKFRIMCRLDLVNHRRSVHLVTYDGLLALIRHGNSAQCREYRNKLAGETCKRFKKIPRSVG